MRKGKKKSSTPKTPEQQKAARLMSAKKQGKKLTKQLKPIVEEQLADMIPGGKAAKVLGKVVDEAIDNPAGFMAQAVHYGKKGINAIRRGGFIVGGALAGTGWFNNTVKRTIKDLDNLAVERETDKRVENRVAEWKKEQKIGNEPRDEWERNLEREARKMKKRIRKQVKEEVQQQMKDKVNATTMEDVTQKHFEQFQEKETVERPKRLRREMEAMALDGMDDYVRDWMGIDPKKKPRESLLYDYAGGTQLTKLIKNVKDINDDPNKSWRNIDMNNVSGAAAEVIGNVNKTSEGSLWSPLVGAGIGAAKKFLNVTNPWWGLAMDVGGLLATTPAARNAVKWVGEKAMGLGRNVINKVKSRNLATMHSEGVIPIVPPKKEEPIVQKPIDYSGVNIPNILLPQESNAAYMMRMTGGMNVGPANANVVTYSGYKKPQYEKVQNRVMLAPPRISSKRGKVRVRRRR